MGNQGENCSPAENRLNVSEVLGEAFGAVKGMGKKGLTAAVLLAGTLAPLAGCSDSVNAKPEAPVTTVYVTPEQVPSQTAETSASELDNMIAELRTEEKQTEMKAKDGEFVAMSHDDFANLDPVKRRGYLDNSIKMLWAHEGDNPDHPLFGDNAKGEVFRELYLASPAEQAEFDAEEVYSLTNWMRDASLYLLPFYAKGNKDEAVEKFNDLFAVINFVGPWAPRDQTIRNMIEDVRGETVSWLLVVSGNTYGYRSFKPNAFVNGNDSTWTDPRTGESYQSRIVVSELPQDSEYIVDLPSYQEWAYVDGVWVLVKATYPKE